MVGRLHRAALQLYRRLPVKARRRVVRTIAPAYTVGSICVIERGDGAVLLVRLSYRNSWGLPGGLLKRGETRRMPPDAR
jgi:8-oxo-dGTP pyrophosphatase MutT (NUDIX family)